MNPNDKLILVRKYALRNWRVPGAEHQVRSLKDITEYKSLIGVKLREETEEVFEQIHGESLVELTKELGDLLSVMRAVAWMAELRWADVETQSRSKDASHGTFNYPEALVWDRSSDD